MKISRWLVLLIIFLSCQENKKHASKSDLTVKLDSLLSTVPDFSGVVLVAEKGKSVYHKAFGFRNFQTRSPMDTTSVFELASVTKPFTSMIIMMMNEEGKLSYDDPVEKFIPGLPYPRITIRHLLNHTSGLPDYQAVMEANWDKSKIADNNDNIAYLKKYHPEKLSEPGEKYAYSNTGYMLLASIAEKASGQDFIEQCRERIFLPLGLTDTDIRTKEEKLIMPNMAWGHIYVPEKQRYIAADSFPAFNYTIWLGNRKGPGRISSTAADLLKWDQALYSDRILKKETFQQAFTKTKLNNGTMSDYGFGWMLRNDTAFGDVVFHDGNNPGYNTILLRYIDVNKTLIVLCNNAHGKYAAIVKNIIMEMENAH